jgi:hypothetical protein
MARSAALKHWRHTTALEGSSVVSVNVDARKQTLNVQGSAGASFEQAMDRVRRRLNEDNDAAAAGTDGLGENQVIDAELVQDNGL